MARAALFAGLALLAAGVAMTLRGLVGWGFLGLAAGFALLFGPLGSRALVRYGGAAAAAVMAVALLMPLAPWPADRRGGAPATPAIPLPVPMDASPERVSVPTPASGPSEEARRAIFRELVLAEKRAGREASATHPDRDSGSAVPDQERMVRRAEKRARLARLLEERYRKEVGVLYGIPEERLPAILEEGRRQGWAENAP